MLSELTLVLALFGETAPSQPSPNEAKVAVVLPVLPALPSFAGAEDAACAESGTGRQCYFHTTAAREAVVAHYRSFAATQGWAAQDLLDVDLEDNRVLLFAKPPLLLRVDIVANSLTGDDDVFIRLAPTPPPSNSQPGGKQ